MAVPLPVRKPQCYTKGWEGMGRNNRIEGAGKPVIIRTLNKVSREMVQDDELRMLIKCKEGHDIRDVNLITLTCGLRLSARRNRYGKGAVGWRSAY